MRNCLSYFFVVAALLLSGCVSVPMASPEADAQAKTYATLPTKANLYVFRHESFGRTNKMTVSLDGKLVGQTTAQTYFLLQVDPGKHEVASLAENVSTLSVDAQAGKNYFVWQEVKMGAWSARSLLQLVDEETGRKRVDACMRAQHNP